MCLRAPTILARSTWWSLVGAIWIVALLSPVSVVGVESDLGDRADVVFSLSHGTGGLHRNGGLVPLHISLENTSDRGRILELEGEWVGGSATVYRTVELAPKTQKQLTFYLGPTESSKPVDTEFVVRLRESDRELREKRMSSSPIPRGDLAVGILGSHSLGWQTLGPSDVSRSDTQPWEKQVEQTPEQRFDGTVVQLPISYLPGRAGGLSPFRVLVWPNPQPGSLRQEQIQALAQWVELGGHLVLTTHAGTELSFSPWTEIRVREVTASRELSSLGDITGVPLEELKEAVAVSVLEPGPNGEVWLSEQWGPLSVHEKRGLGSVLVVGCDLGEILMTGWPGVGMTWLAVLEQLDVWRSSDFEISQGHSSTAWVSPIELRSAARSFLTRVPEGRPLPVAGLLLVWAFYLAMIGPVEYLTLKRLKRLRWTWVTYPLLVVLFTWAVYSMARDSHSGTPVLRHVLVRDLLPTSRVFRDELHAALFVTESERYRLEPYRPAGIPVVDPESSASHKKDRIRFYEQGPAAITARPPKWGFLAGSFLMEERSDELGVRADLRRKGRALQGHFTPRLGTDLAEASLLFAVDGVPTLWPLGSIQDGEPFDLADVRGESFPMIAHHRAKARSTTIEDLVGVLSLRSSWALQQIRAARLTGSPREIRLGVQEFLSKDSNPGQDWSSLLLDGGAVLVGWAPDSERRVSVEGLEPVHEGYVMFRVPFYSQGGGA